MCVVEHQQHFYGLTFTSLFISQWPNQAAVDRLCRRMQPPVLHVANVDSSKFQVDRANHVWANNFICGYMRVHEHLVLKGQVIGATVGLNCVVDGTVPIVQSSRPQQIKIPGFLVSHASKFSTWISYFHYLFEMLSEGSMHRFLSPNSLLLIPSF
ncbi:hypothetical protein M758_UG145600 [Ceratodon purpureus]|nr:hypothetical protein M758_UG145600 [Ceratodon purpureus]